MRRLVHVDVVLGRVYGELITMNQLELLSQEYNYDVDFVDINKFEEMRI